MATISAYTSDALKRRIEEIMREEGRKQAQVGSTALELYARLPAAARRACLELAAAEGQRDTDLLVRVIAEVTRSLLHAKWELADARLAKRVRERGGLPQGELTEEGIARLAVEVTGRTDAEG